MQTCKNLIDLFSNSATKHADRLAVCYDDGSTKQTATYLDIYERSKKVCHSLGVHSCQKEIVGLVLKPSVHLPTFLIGMMLGEATFYTLEDDVSSKRLLYLVEKLHIRLILVHPELHENIQKKVTESGLELLECCMDQDNEMWMYIVKGIVPKKWPHQFAYVITTSGTTGLPKIVKVPHQCILPNILHFRHEFKLMPDDVVFLASSLTFDASIVEIFMTLAAGATLLIVPKAIKRMPNILVDILDTRNKVTVLQASPSLLHSIGSRHLQRTILSARSSLRVLALGAEKCPPCNVLKSWRQHGNGTKFYNLYGITEVSSWASVYEITGNDFRQERKDIPLGSPIMDTDFKIMDTEGNVATEGQLFIGGEKRVCLIDEETELRSDTYRATGDWVRSESNGDITYISRMDDQIKRHGKRMNLSELEMVALNTPGVIQASAVLHKDTQLLLFARADSSNIDCEWKNMASFSTSNSVWPEMMQDIKSTLPAHYYPDDIVVRASFPMTKHGKVDKARLLETWKALLSVEKMDLLESLSHQWQSCCGELPGASDNFIMQGGDSLKAVQLADKLEEISGGCLPLLLDYLLNNTYAEVAHYIQDMSSQTITRGSCKYITNEQSCSSTGESSINSADSDIKNISPHKKRRMINGEDKVDDSHLQMHENSTNISEHIVETGLPVPSHKHDKIKRRCKESLKYIPFYSVSRACGYHKHTNSEGKSSTCCSHPAGISESCDKESDAHICHSSGETVAQQALQIKQKWIYDTGKCVDASPLIAICKEKALVFIGSHSSKFSAICLESGKSVWEVWLQDRVESSACLSYCGRFVIVGCYSGDVHVLSVESGEETWVYKTAATVKSSPCADKHNSLVYIGSHDKHLHALDVEKRELVWKQYIRGGSVFSSPCVSTCPHQLYAATLTGCLCSLQPDSGHIIWQNQLNKPIFSSPTVSHTGVCVGCVDGLVYCFSHQGEMLWKYRSDGAIFSSPCMWPPITTTSLSANKHLTVIGSHDSFVHCVSTDTGDLMWKTSIGSPVYATPFVFSVDRSVVCTPSSGDRNSLTDVRLSNFDKTISCKSQMCTCFLANCLEYNLNDNNIPGEIGRWKTMFVAVCASEGKLVILSLQTGQVITSYNFPDETFSSPVVVGANIIVGCRDDNVYCLALS